MSELLTPLSALTLGLSRQQLTTLQSQGIHVLGQLYEALTHQSKALKKVGIPSDLLALCKAHYACLQQPSAFGAVTSFMPALGGILDPKDSPQLMQHRADTEPERLTLAQHAKTLENSLPEEFLHTLHEPRDQLNLGACTGFGSTAAREFHGNDALSPGFAYRGAKKLDNMPHVEGSYQEYCYQWFVECGQLLEQEYDYDKCCRNEDVKPYLKQAERFKIDNYLDLLVAPDHLSTVLKAALCGQLSDAVAPSPVSISLAVYESFLGESARRFGLIPVPFEGEALSGGHAMCVAGYTQLYDTCYFLVLNSWGTSWANENPLSMPGYALIPEEFICKPGLVAELLMPM